MKRLFLVLAMLLICTAFAAHAQTAAKVGVIDLGKCILTSNAGIRADAELKTFGNDLAAKLKLKETGEAFEKLRKEYTEQEKVLTEKAKRDKMEALQAKGIEFETAQRSFQTEVQKKERELMEQIQKDLVKIIDAVAKEGKFTVIVDLQAVAYAADGIDITETVLKRYNEQVKK